ncbi:MAG TPA: CpsD/CapB family tyrosine-protein kinase [Bryobacteraceae bacterium]|nr:CpsD/CapB family tyrosine-protein kinase [Bryobacteraceae bacterium]
MSKVFDALAREEAVVPKAALSALLEELASAKARLRPVPNGKPSEVPAAPPAIRAAVLQIAARSPLLPFEDANSAAAERYRIARTRITQHPGRPTMIVVSSAGRGDGKTVTAINLAGSFSLKAEGGVLLVDADFRHSSMIRQLGLGAAPGLAEVLEGRNALEEALTRAGQFPNLYLLPAGQAAMNPGELLDSERWRELARRLRQSFEYVVVDSPPVAAVADYELIQSVCDGTLLVLRPDHTRRRSAAEAFAAIGKDKLIGVVLNSVPKRFWWGAGDRAVL